MVAFVSCSETPDVVVPNSGASLLLSETKRLTPAMRASIEGVYSVVDGGDVFGDLLVLKWSYVVNGPSDTSFTLSAFAGRDVAYFDLQGGTLDSVFFFTGTWRKMVNTETGVARFVIGASHGGRQLFKPSPVIGKDSIVFAGEFGSGQDLPNRQMNFRYLRPLSTSRRFEVLAHRGGGRTSDLLPVSENSVAMILFTSRLGSTGIEIDIHKTKDGVLVLYHDSEINSRLTQKSGLVGPIEAYTYAQLKTMVRLIHGEQMPTLREALDAALERTAIRVVWFDVKKTADIASVRAIQKEYAAKAASMGREFSMLIGLPTEDQINEFLQLPDYSSAPALCELSLDDVRRTNARVWAPRWTLGTQLAEVGQVHSDGRKAFVWTVDVPAYVKDFIANGDFDGILTNYPTIVAFYHYSR